MDYGLRAANCGRLSVSNKVKTVKYCVKQCFSVQSRNFHSGLPQNDPLNTHSLDCTLQSGPQVVFGILVSPTVQRSDFRFPFHVHFGLERPGLFSPGLQMQFCPNHPSADSQAYQVASKKLYNIWIILFPIDIFTRNRCCSFYVL